MIHLDATFVVDFLRETYKKRRGPTSEFLASLAERREKITVSVFVASELFAGVRCSHRPDEERDRVWRFCEDFGVVYPDERFAETYGGIFGSLRRSGQMVGTMDVLIGTLAIIEGARLVTRNLKDFKRIPELEILSY